MQSIKNSKPKSILETDFYQLTMAYAYLMTNEMARDRTGFESFVRQIKGDITTENYYIFNAEKEVRDFIDNIKKEIREPDFFDRYWDIIKDKVDQRTYNKAKKEFNKLYKFFTFSVLENGSKVKPFVPVFQYNGPRFFGQLLETPITNIINGRVGLKSQKKDSVISLFNENDKQYIQKIKKRAKEYRRSTSKIILEAGYRRAPSFYVAKKASMAAIQANWDGTSNTSIYKDIDSSLIGGSMAHAYVMSFEKNGKTNEVEAFKSWDKLFPKSTMLIDTYNVSRAIDILIQNNIKPAAVRIDSEPIEDYVYLVRQKLDNANWSDVKIFISGDITPEKLKYWEEKDLPFDMCMAGTHYVNIDTAKHINPGFVYKIVEFSKNGNIEYPEKKSTAKGNYPGLKTVYFNKKNNKIIVSVKRDSCGFKGDSFKKINKKTEVIFDRLS